MPPQSKARPCQWRTQQQAFEQFATHVKGTEGAEHIKPLHWYIACRLVLEGGFDPDWITPRPPFKCGPLKTGGFRKLEFNAGLGGTGEQTIMGGLKTKDVDVVVTNPKMGPVLAISCKGATGAFRNLTNRLEETIGECTNLHITYPALVMGYFMLMRGNRTQAEAEEGNSSEILADPAQTAQGEDASADDVQKVDPAVTSTIANSEIVSVSRAISPNDIAITTVDGHDVATEIIARFHDALVRMTLRQDLRDDISRYEAMALTIVEVKSTPGSVFEAYPPAISPLHSFRFFQTLYSRYDERFVLGAKGIGGTRRNVWSENSPALSMGDSAYLPRTE